MTLDDSPTTALDESRFEREIDRQQEPTDREYERRWWTLGVLCISLVMIVMANASLNVALPTLAESLHAGSSGLQWIVDAYSLVFAGLLLTAGSLGDRYGRRPRAERRADRVRRGVACSRRCRARPAR